MRLALFAPLALLSLLAPSAGRATVGGPDHIELLGYEPVDGKLYYFVHHGGEVGDLPQLHFLALHGDAPASPQRAHSWYDGDSRAAEAAFPERRAKLEARLTRLAPTLTEGARLEVVHRDLRVCGRSPKQPQSAEEARAIVEAYRRDPGSVDYEYAVCRRVEVRLDAGPFGAAVGIETQGQLTLAGVWPTPDPRFAFAVLRHIGKPFETGYAVDVPVLLTREGAAPVEASPTVDGCPGLPRGAAPGSVAPEVAGPGTRLAAAPAGLDRRPWRRVDGRVFSVASVRYVAWTLHHDDTAVLAVTRPGPSGGDCVVTVAEDAFGGNGVEAIVTQIADGAGGGAVVVWRHDRRPRSGSPERVFSALHVAPEGPRWLLSGGAPGAERLVVRWGGKGPALHAVRGEKVTPLP